MKSRIFPWYSQLGSRTNRNSRIEAGYHIPSAAVLKQWGDFDEDLGKTLLIGGDLDRSFPTLEFRLDAEGRPSVRHRIRQGQKWLAPIGTNEAVPPGRWTRMTYTAGWGGRRLYINSQMVASAQAEPGPVSPVFHIAPTPLKGTVGRLKVISGDGFLL